MLKVSSLISVAAAVVVLALCCCVRDAAAVGCHGAATPGQPNLSGIIQGEPVFVRSYVGDSEKVKGARGKLYTAGSGTSQFSLVHVWGTPYEMGFAEGTLLKDQINYLMPAVWDYMKDQVITAKILDKFPLWFRDWIAKFGLDTALDLTEVATKPWTGQYFLDELRGISDATGLDYKTSVRIHLIGALTEGKCSMFGAWGDALTHTNTKLLQLRALDWDTEGPFRDAPVAVVYHPNADNGHAFINLGWAGWVASISGMSSKQMGISEIGVSFPGDDFGKESRIGYPFTYLLRDILQFDNTLDEAVERICTGPGTCDLLLGVGDGKSSRFHGFAVSSTVCNIYNDTNLEPLLNGSHPRIPNIVYWGMDWICPADDILLSAQLQKYYGNLTVDNVVRDVMSVVQTGDLQVALYDLTNMKLWISNAAAHNQTGPMEAYRRPFVELDANALFAESAPELADVARKHHSIVHQ